MLASLRTDKMTNQEEDAAVLGLAKAELGRRRD